MPLPRRAPLALLLTGLLVAATAVAHETTPMPAVLALTVDGTFTLTLTTDLDALALGVGHHAPSEETAARLRAMSAAERAERLAALADLFARRVRVRFDGEPAELAVRFPDAGAGESTVFGRTAVLAGAVPAGAAEVVVFASRAFPALDLTVRRADGAEVALRVPQATPSRAFPVTPPPVD